MSAEQMEKILNIIEHLDALPEDHEPDLEILWDTIRSIEDIAKEGE